MGRDSLIHTSFHKLRVVYIHFLGIVAPVLDRRIRIRSGFLSAYAPDSDQNASVPFAHDPFLSPLLYNHSATLEVVDLAQDH